ncbi:MAG: DUF4870 domain-containing protein [Cryobacterium sp.]
MSDPNAQQPQDPHAGSPHEPPKPVALAPLPDLEDRQWASLAHLGGIFGILPALIIWLVFRERGRLTEVEAKEALNFQITLLFGYVALIVLGGIVTIATLGILNLSWLTGLLWAAGVVFSILGFVRAKDGGHYRYPFAVRLIS